MTNTMNKPNGFNQYTDALTESVWSNELNKYTVEENDDELDKVCATCKYHKDCEGCGWYLGCGVWEAYMGDCL